jgi:alpha-L-fucosidase 2
MNTKQTIGSTLLVVLTTLFALNSHAGHSGNEQDFKSLKLWYTKPAFNWNEALPIGNGRLGAMIFGNPAQERLQLNEESVYSGGPNNNVSPESGVGIEQVRKLLFEEKFIEAQAYADEHLMPKGNSGMAYQPVGNLYLQFPGHEKPVNYYRDLDIENAIANVVYEVDGVKFSREVFSSYPDQVIVMRLTASKPGKISFSAFMDSPLKFDSKTSGGELVLSGISSDHEGVKGAVKFKSIVKVVPDGGSVSATDTSLVAKNCNSATVFISMATNFKNYHDLSKNPESKAKTFLNNASKKKFEQIKNAHIADYRAYFDRVKLDLGTTESIYKPTNVRIAEFAESNDPHLVALYFQFGRYLLISSSRPGTQPANLQGIWNDKPFPAWDSKYTININTEMNYWPAEVTNLSELHHPLFRMIKDLSVTGQETARLMYNAKGWVTHHNTDIWRITGPVDRPYSGMWPMGGAWLSQHLWDHYQFTGDLSFLKEYYPALKGSSRFFLDVLQEEPKNGWLVVSPSNSPENTYVEGKRISIAAGTTMDNQLVFDLFAKTIEVAGLIGTDASFADSLKIAKSRLAPMQIGKHGQLQEWMHDFDRPNDKHRHVSHLYGLYPSNQISPYRTPELFDAARTSLLFRGDLATGWSMGWKVCFWARFLDGNHAYKLIKDQLRLVEENGETLIKGGGTYVNMFDAHPPFQIDGNFGCTAGIAEMLVQSHDGTLHVLPALPDDLSSGAVSGLKARGGFEVDIQWANQKITKLTIHSNLGGNCRIRVHQPIRLQSKGELVAATGENPNPFYKTPVVKAPLISPSAKLNEVKISPSQVYDLKTVKGKSYELVGE